MTQSILAWVKRCTSLNFATWQLTKLHQKLNHKIFKH